MREIIHLLHYGPSQGITFTRGATNPVDPYDGFSVCHYTGDDPSRVANARQDLSTLIGIPLQRIIIPRQTHSVNVLTIDSLPIPHSRLEGVDALVTNLPSVALCINTADCVPVVMADGKGVIAVAHAGWRGMAGGVIERTIETMSRLGADKGEIMIACGPHISVSVFEVGEEVAEKFDADGAVERRECRPRPFVNLYRSLVSRALSAGLKIDNILPLPDNFCSFSKPEKFFSARRLGVNSGRTPTIIFNCEQQ